MMDLIFQNQQGEIVLSFNRALHCRTGDGLDYIPTVSIGTIAYPIHSGFTVLKRFTCHKQT